MGPHSSTVLVHGNLFSLFYGLILLHPLLAAEPLLTLKGEWFPVAEEARALDCFKSLF